MDEEFPYIGQPQRIAHIANWQMKDAQIQLFSCR